MELPMTRNNATRWLLLSLLFYGSAASSGWAQTGAASPQSAQSTEIGQAPKITIGPGDQLTVEVFDTPELSSSVRVSQTGEANLTVLGRVQLAGLTANEAALKIESAFKTRGLLIDPHVTVSIAEYASQGATVMGEVHLPGLYPTLGSRKLLDMISLAGGPTSTAGKTVTILHRDDPQHPVNVTLVQNISDLAAQENPVIQPGDTIAVGKAGIVYILGAVSKPGGFLIDNNEHLSLMQALTLAGGWVNTAAMSQARLIRQVPEGREEIKLDLKHVVTGRQADIRVNNGDILFVPSSLAKTIAYQGISSVLLGAEQATIYSTVARP
jgi:polysaccharide export outer membrane protein